MLPRDSILWSRSPIRRSTCRFVRPSRCFSKCSPTCARYNNDADDDGGKKPDGMSDLEWMRQRHLRRWRKRIEQDPYQALFGASEDMLRGRGLEGYIQRQREMHRKGMEWVEKTFPKWMLEDMGFHGRGEDKSSEAKEGAGTPNKMEVGSVEEVGGIEREGVFPQPSHRAPSYRRRRFEKDFWNDGVESPSDSRRPREVPVGAFQSHDILHEDIVERLRKDREIPQETVPPKQTSVKANVSGSKPSSKSKLAPKRNMLPEVDTSVPETTFIEEFLAGRTSTPPPDSPGRANSNEWRQTTLERRTAQSSTLRLRRKTNVPVVDVAAKYQTLSALNPGNQKEVRPAVKSKGTPGQTVKKAMIEFQGVSGSRVGRKEIEDFPNQVNEDSDKVEIHDNYTTVEEPAQDVSKSRLSPYPKINADESVAPSGQDKKPDDFPGIDPDISSTRDLKFDRTAAEIFARPRRSTSDVLKQLPKDDLDFLTADDVRASMGHMKNKDAGKAAARQKLEQEFNKETPEIDPMLEAQVVNNQFVRRKTNEMTAAQEPKYSTKAESSTDIPERETVDTPSKPASVLETSLDFMSRWLHNGGNVFAQHFWQDPVPLVAGQLAGADEQFLKGIGIGVLKGRRAFASIKDELIEDIPASQELMDRLNRDEMRASAGAVRLYRELPSALKDTRDSATSKTAAHKRIGQLRQALLDTDKQYEKACEAFDSIKNASKPSFLQEKRHRYACEVLRKNAKLTRMSIFGLQGRIEVEAGSSGGLVARELLHRLLALQDTQLALSRLVSRSMQVLGIDPEGEEVSKTSDGSTVDMSDPSIVGALASVAAKDGPAKQGVDVAAAANEKLEDAVSRPKKAMRGLGDDGCKYPPKPSVSKSFDGPNPLAHSLFRPFGLQLDSLGKDVDAEKDGADNAAEKAKGDKELVEGVRDTYEDTYGLITVDHRQVPPTESPPTMIREVTEVSETKTAKLKPSIQLLKEDEISPLITRATSASTKDPISVLQDDVTTESAAQVDTDPKKERTEGTAMAENLPPLDTSDTHFGIQKSFDTEEAVRVEQATPITELSELSGLGDTPASSISTGNEYSYDTSTNSYVPISYKTLIYNAETDKLSVTTSQVPQPNPPITPIPLHEALATLSHPAKFIDHLPEVFHVIAAKPDVLSVRTASSSSVTAERNTTTTVDKTSVEPKAELEETEVWKGINPVDGTTTLSPTGFVGMGSDLDREVDFAERRRKADEYHREVNKLRKVVKEPEKKERRRIGLGAMVKTAIWAGAFCYVVGVAAEIAKAPF